MAKARFKRAESGYDASYVLGDHKYEATLLKSEDGKRWTIGSGFGESDRVWGKLRDLKDEWAGWCEADASTGEAPAPVPAPPPIGPPKIGPPKIGPPKIGPPKIGPPAIKPSTPAVVEQGERPPGKTIALSPAPQTRGAHSSMTSEDGGNAHQHADPEKFAAYLHARGKLLGPCTEGGSNDFRCESCGAHVSDWERVEPDKFVPPCRCGRSFPNSAAYLPCWDDPMMWFFAPDAVYMRPTKIGALDMVYNWMRTHADLCTFKGKLLEPFATVLNTLIVETERPEYTTTGWESTDGQNPA